MSISFWMYIDSETYKSIVFLQTYSFNSDQAGWAISIVGEPSLDAGKIRFNAMNGSHRHTPDTVPLQQWVHVTLIWDTASSGYSAFINGSESIISANYTALCTNTDKPLVLNGGSAEVYFDDLAIWDSALSEGQARALSQAPAILEGYNVGEMQKLFELWQTADTSESVSIGELNWTYAEGFDTTGHAVGDVWENNGTYYMWLDGGTYTPNGLRGSAYPQSELLYYFPFDDGADFSLQNMGIIGGNAAPNGTPTTSASFVPSGINSAAALCLPNSSSNLVLPGSTDLLRLTETGDQMSFTFWMYMDSTTYKWISTLQTYYYNSDSNGWALSVAGGPSSNEGRLRPKAMGGAERYVYEQLPLEQWVHVVFIWDTTTGYSAYFDGVQKTINYNYAALCSPTTKPIVLGGGTVPVYYDDVAIWNGALTPGQARALYGAPALLDGYNVAVMDKLFNLWESADTDTIVNVSTLEWQYSEGFDASGRTVGDVWEQNGYYYMWFDGSSAAPTGVKGTLRAQDIDTMEDSTNWSVPTASQGMLSLLQVADRVGVSITNFSKGNTAEIILNQPIAMPEWSNDVQLNILSRDEWPLGLNAYLLVTDSRGFDYKYKLVSALLPQSTQFFPNNFKPRPVRLNAPGFIRPVLYSTSGYNIWALDEGNSTLPVAPFNISGMQFESVSYKEPDEGQTADPVVISLGDFEFTNLNWRTADFYYSLADEDHYGANEPVPSLTLGQLGQLWYGESFLISWELYDTYDGQPIMTGEASYTFDRNDPDYDANFMERIEFPVFEKGTFWVRTKKIWDNFASTYPDRVDEKEFRLDILHGQPATVHSEIPSEQRIPNSWIRMEPALSRFVVDAGLSIDWTSRVWKRDGREDQTYTWTLSVTQAISGVEVVSDSGTLAAGSGPFDITSTLGNLDPGAYEIHIELLENGYKIDQSTRLFGVREPETTPGAIPASVPSWQDMMSGPSIIYMMPHGHENYTDPEQRWEKLEYFLDTAAGITDTVEFIVRWNEIEPLEGVYDWSELDRFLDYAEQKGITVLIWPSLAGREPEWLRAVFEEPRTEDGEIFNPIPYTFHKARVNYCHAESMKAEAITLYQTIARRYKDHPAVHGYYVLLEHPTDVYTSGWYVGGSEESQTAFREQMQNEFSTLQTLNSRWGTQYTNWDQVGLPPNVAKTKEQLDWLSFLSNGVDELTMDYVDAIRAEDTHRIIQVYTGCSSSYSWQYLANQGCMLADGGSETPETFGSDAMNQGEYGLHHRAEEVSVGKWADKYPTQLDSTLFTMLLSGGLHSNVKMFYFVSSEYQTLLPAPYALQRFIDFIPIWQELRYTLPMEREVYLLEDKRSGMLYNEDRTDSYRDVWAFDNLMDAGLTAPGVEIDKAVQGKMIHLPRIEYYEENIIDELESFVTNGGVLVMNVNAGRYSPDLPNQDWVLAQRLGFNIPGNYTSGYMGVYPVIGDVFDSSAGSWRLRDTWLPSLKADETVIANIGNDPARPVMTYRNIGLGKVVMIYATSNIPAHWNEEYPFMRDIAVWAGVTINGEADSPSLWTNLLQESDSDDYYGLVYHPSTQITSKPPVQGNVYWSLPAGTYQVTEMISNTSLGQFTAQQLAETGISTYLNPFELAIYRMDKVTP